MSHQLLLKNNKVIPIFNASKSQCQHLSLPNTVASANAFDSPIYFITILATEIQVLTVTTFDPEQTMGITLTLATKLTLDFGQLHVIPLSKNVYPSLCDVPLLISF